MKCVKFFLMFIAAVLGFSFGAKFLWSNGAIELPVVVIHSARLLGASVAQIPKATVELDIPFHRQEHSLSCEAASLKTAFYAYGLDVPESDILSVLAFDPTPRSGGVWGDPNKGLVGNIDGKMFQDGYGVYADPIAKAGLRWKRTEVLKNAEIRELTEWLAQGYPVVIWGYLGRGIRGTWQTPEGKQIDAVNGEHTFLVYGFSGSGNNPDGFFVVDPIYGHEYLEIEDFVEKWDALGRMGVVVYPHSKWIRAEGDTRVWEISKDGKTRRWVDVTWEEFEQMGGFAEAVRVVSPKELAKFVVGENIGPNNQEL